MIKVELSKNEFDEILKLVTHKLTTLGLPLRGPYPDFLFEIIVKLKFAATEPEQPIEKKGD